MNKTEKGDVETIAVHIGLLVAEFAAFFIFVPWLVNVSSTIFLLLGVVVAILLFIAMVSTVMSFVGTKTFARLIK